MNYGRGRIFGVSLYFLLSSLFWYTPKFLVKVYSWIFGEIANWEAYKMTPKPAARTLRSEHVLCRLHCLLLPSRNKGKEKNPTNRFPPAFKKVTEKHGMLIRRLGLFYLP